MEIRSWDIRTETHGSNREFTFEQVIDMFRRLIFLGKRERDSQDNLTDFAEYVEDVIAVATLQAKGNNVRAWQSLEDLLQYAMKSSGLGAACRSGNSPLQFTFYYERPGLEDCQVIIVPEFDGRNRRAFISWGVPTPTVIYIITGEYPPASWNAAK
jgi:hypothetical protein